MFTLRDALLTQSRRLQQWGIHEVTAPDGPARKPQPLTESAYSNIGFDHYLQALNTLFGSRILLMDHIQLHGF